MNMNSNMPPPGKIPPPMWEGKKVVYVQQAVIDETASEIQYKCLLADGDSAVIPLSAFVNKED